MSLYFEVQKVDALFELTGYVARPPDISPCSHHANLRVECSVNGSSYLQAGAR